MMPESKDFDVRLFLQLLREKYMGDGKKEVKEKILNLKAHKKDHHLYYDTEDIHEILKLL